MSFILFVGGIVIGFVIGWLVWGGSVSRLSREVRRYKSSLEETQSAREPERIALARMKEQNQALRSELETVSAQLAEGREERWELRCQLARAEAAAEAEATARESEPTVPVAQLDELREQLATARDALDEERAFHRATKFELHAVRAERDTEVGQVAALRAELAAAAIGGDAAPVAAEAPSAPKPRKKPIAKILRDAQLSGPPDDSADDLTAINGIGPALRRRLHEIGITSFQQIADLTAEEIARVDSALDFKGRIARERWIAQAREILETRMAG